MKKHKIARFFLTWAGTLLLLLTLTTKTWAGGVELHAHLFMKQGMSWLFKGDFNDPLQAQDWTSRLSSQVNAEAMARSQLDLIVVTLYAHPLLTLSLRDSIRNQLQKLNDFLKQHPQWALAKDPFQAQKALSEGRKILVLALEGGSGILETQEDLREFIDDQGIRIVTYLHLTDDHWGGVAFLKGVQAWASPWAYLLSLFRMNFQDLESGKRIVVNKNGLTPLGKERLKQLLHHHVWIDFAHSSDASQEEMRSLLPDSEYPLLYTHTVLRRFFGAERGISDTQLKAVAQSRGFIGLMPSEEMLRGTTTRFQHPECREGIFALASQFQVASSILGESSVALGSDYNGGITHLKPTPHCLKTQAPLNLQKNGLWELGQSHQIWEDLHALGVWHPKAPSISGDHSHAQTFINTWARAWKSMDRLSLEAMTQE
ncbi:hypothetical protein EBS43_08675 [bacterium]|nr:hypothetical protein [bacterium]